MISSAGMSWATAHRPSEQNGLIVHNIFTFVKYSEGIKPLLKNQTEDNLMSNMQEIYSSLVMWNTHICDIKKGTAQTENIESLRVQLVFWDKWSMLFPKEEGGKIIAEWEMQQHFDEQILSLFKRTLQPFLLSSAQ